MSKFALHLRRVRCAAVLFSLSLPVAAQCGFDWQPGAPAAGVKGNVWAALPASNGDLIVGGDFLVADASVTNRIARWNGTTWSPLGAGIGDGTVWALAQLPNGDVIAGGQFTSAGGQPAVGLARWNGGAWSQLGALGSGRANALAVMPNGDLIVAGEFTAVSGVPVSNIARWDGSSWSALGMGLPEGPIYTLVQEPNGGLIAGGLVPSIAGVMANGLARWNGSSWSAIFIPTLPMNTTVISLARLPNGNLAFATSQATGNLALWNGAQLQWLTPPVAQILSLAVAPSGQLVASGFTGFGPTDPSVAILAGGTWIDFSAGAPRNANLLRFDGTGALIAAGYTPGVRMGVYLSTGQPFVPLGIAEAPPRVNAVQRLANGDVAIGGQFDSIAGAPLVNIARWNGSAYVPLGLGVGGQVRALAIASNGDLLVGGDFTTAGGAPAPHVARWNGTSWSTLGGGLPAIPTMLAGNAAGEVLAVAGAPGAQVVWRFDGFTWSLQSLGFGAPTIFCIHGDPHGDIVLGGLFLSGSATTGGLRYTGGGFQPLASTPFHMIRGFARSSTGELVGLGTFAGIGPAARLVGSTWSAIGSGASAAWLLRQGTFLPNGDLVVAGVATEVQGQPANGLLRFDGSVWSAIPGLAGPSVVGLAASDDGELFAAGTLETAGTHVSVGVARAEPLCPAAVVAFGAGCTGAAGPVSLAADSLPWAGATFRATAMGIPASALALHAIGVQPNLLPLPMGAPGCFLYVDPIELSLLAPAGGAASVAFAVPDSPSLAGVLLRSQVAVVELGAGLAIVRLTSSNALVLTIGVL